MTDAPDPEGEAQPPPETPKYDFRCYYCGVECNEAPPLPVRAVCPKCCAETSGHDYKYVREMRDHLCMNCGVSAPSDWYDE